MNQSSGPLKDSFSFGKRNTKLLREMSPSPYFKITSYQYFGKSLIRTLATPLVLHLTFRFIPSVLSLLLYWNPQWCIWSTLLTWFLWVILIGVPTSNWQSTLPIQYSISLRSHPRYYRLTDIPLVYSSSVSRTAKPLTQKVSLYPPFEVYLTTIYGRLSFVRLS